MRFTRAVRPHFRADRKKRQGGVIVLDVWPAGLSSCCVYTFVRSVLMRAAAVKSSFCGQRVR